MPNTHGKIIIVGDLFPVPSNFNRFAAGDIDYLFGKQICDLFEGADYRICNLEGALTDHAGKCEKTGAVLYAPSASIEGIKKLGIDCCTLANNHITDAGGTGVIDTMNTLAQAGIHYIGAGLNAHEIRRFHTFEVANLKFGLYNVAETMFNVPSETTPGAFLYDEYLVCKEIEEYKKECDYLVVVYHGGAEKYRLPSPKIKQRFHRMVDSGANMVLSQHTHCVGSEEYYKGAYLLYGQGNFLFRSFNNEYTDTGLIIELSIENMSIAVYKHLVDAIDDTVRYDTRQDFTSFNERSAKLSDDNYLQKQYDDYALKELPHYLAVFKGRSFSHRVLRHLFPDLYSRILFKSYARNQILFIMHTLRSEQNREIALTGLRSYLDCN